MWEPLTEVKDEIFSKLKSDKREPSDYYFLLSGLLQTNFQTYKAIRKLVAIDPKYPTQAHILGRSVIDALFVILRLTENPHKYSRAYMLAGYLEGKVEHERELFRYGKNEHDKAYFEDKKKFLGLFGKRLNVTQEEEQNPNKNFWPTPHQLIIKKELTDNKQKLAEEVYCWRYGQVSEWSHQLWGGMAMGIFSEKAEAHWIEGKFESDSVYMAILFFLMILSEVEGSCRYGTNQKLKYIWTLLGSAFGEAKDYYDLRYSVLLDEQHQ